jgi:hypothetical protein
MCVVGDWVLVGFFFFLVIDCGLVGLFLVGFFGFSFVG